MWVRDTKGVARNLNLAHKIEIGERYGNHFVYATFALKGEKNANDPAFYEIAVLADYDNAQDAENFLTDIVEKLNRI